jgi:hypothetical protein
VSGELSGTARARGIRLPLLSPNPHARLSPAGCFHVPRCLAMCEEMLDALLSRLPPDSDPTSSPPVVPTPRDAK